jgi:periplasmic copper chaperone A
MIRKLAIVGAIVTGAVALVAGPAFAHVEIEREGDVSSTGVVAATLSVPNEKDDAGTVSIELVFPATPKLTTVEAEAVNGWTATVRKAADGSVEAVTWTGGPVTGDEEAELPLSIGDVPDDVDTVDFKAIQTYDDGDVVRWIEPTPEGSEEPEHPAPVLTVRGEAGGHDEAEEAGHDDGESHDDSDSTLIVAIVVIVVIILGLIVFMISRSRKKTGTPQA